MFKHERKKSDTYERELFPLGTAKDKEGTSQFTAAMHRKVQELVCRFSRLRRFSKDFGIGLGGNWESERAVGSHGVPVSRDDGWVEDKRS